MSTILEAIRDKPLAAFKLDSTAPYQDYSGYNNTGTATGSPQKSTALSSGVQYSTVFDNGSVGKFFAPSPVLKQGYEASPFSLEAWSYPIIRDVTDPTEQQILGRSGLMDGITINGTIVSFVTKYLTSGECRVSYDLQVNRRFYVVGVHNAEKNSLYIDGVLVGETELTDAQKLDQYVLGSDSYLYSGNTTGTTALAMNNVCIYGTGLSPDVINRHFSMGNRHLSFNSVLKGISAVRIPMSQNEGDVFLEQSWSSATDWINASLSDTVVENERIKPRLVSGVSIAGTWTDLFVMSVTDLVSIYGVNMVWDGDGAIVEASLDGIVWETVERGKNLDIIPPGFDPTEKELLIRISFPGGIADDPSYVDNMTVTGFKTGVTPPVHGRDITFTSPAYIRNEHEPVEYSDDWGARLPHGYVSITEDSTDDPMLPGTIELWIKPNNTEKFYIDGRTGSGDVSNFLLNIGDNFYSATRMTGYINGNLRTTEALRVGEWSLIHIVPDTPLSGKLTINAGFDSSIIDTSTGDITVGQIVLYEDALTAAQIADLYESYTSLNVAKANDSSFVQITEPTTAAVIIDADWSIVSAG